MKTGTRLVWTLVPLAAVVVWLSPAFSASHQWRFNELFSNADGTVQFIEMKECCGLSEETQLTGKWVLAVHAGHQVNFRSDLVGDTAHAYLLLATQKFADIPGAPTPDVIIPEGFLPVPGDTLEYWMYDLARWIYPALPTDGITSRGPSGTEVNSPTNFNGDTGSIDLTVPVRKTTWGILKSRGTRENP